MTDETTGAGETEVEATETENTETVAEVTLPEAIDFNAKEYRSKTMKLSQKDLAEMLGVTAQRISMAESEPPLLFRYALVGVNAVINPVVEAPAEAVAEAAAPPADKESIEFLKQQLANALEELAGYKRALTNTARPVDAKGAPVRRLGRPKGADIHGRKA